MDEIEWTRANMHRRARQGLDAGCYLVDEFRERIGGVAEQTMDQVSNEERFVLKGIATGLLSLSKVLEPLVRDDKEALALCMSQLLVEELSELLLAVYAGDEVEALDALADLQFVLLRWAKALDLPIGAAFVEVCKSNMTKAPLRPGDNRLRDKGPDYVPPDLKTVLEDHRVIPF